MSSPLVSVVCLCYNQRDFVVEAMESVLQQDYKHKELIVVDDGSSDGSKEVIREFLKQHPEVPFIDLRENRGNCFAFNQGWRISRGDFLIDLAADDVLMPSRLSIGIQAFGEKDSSYGVQFGDAEQIDENGQYIALHSNRFPAATIPLGDLYAPLVRRYFISGPSMLVRRDVFEKLDGYDESLAYEDFDFWIRSARHFKYFYTPEVLVRQRILPDSLSKQQFKKGSNQLQSTFRVCEKILSLNRNKIEQAALRDRLIYELRKSIQLLDFGLAKKYVGLIRRNKAMQYTH